jgi:hypothetical protein
LWVVRPIVTCFGLRRIYLGLFVSIHALSISERSQFIGDEIAIA